MDIRKTPPLVSDVALPARLSGVARATLEKPGELRDVVVSRGQETEVVTDDRSRQRKSALQRLEAATDVSPGQDAPSRARLRLDHATRRALDAYQTQQNQAHNDERATLSGLLGVDYYA